MSTYGATTIPVAVPTNPSTEATGDPALDVWAAFLFATAMAYMRRPEYVRTYGEIGKVTQYQEAHAMMMRIQAAKQRLPEVSQVSPPKNIGGVVSATGTILIGNHPSDF